MSIHQRTYPDQEPSGTLLKSECLAALRLMPDNSVDSIVTDPPYELGMMNKTWDSSGIAYSVEFWTEALRVLKPGGHLLAAGGTRTYHRMTCAIEDAGFDIRDSVAWVTGSGFPKSLSPYKQEVKKLCPSLENAQHAVRLSLWHLVELPGVKEPTALTLAEILPEGDLVVLIRTGAEDGSFEVTATSLSDWTIGVMSWNTVSSCRGYSAETWQRQSTSIFETVIGQITDPRTLNFSRFLNTLDVTTPDETRPDGCLCDAVSVASLSSEGLWSWSHTQMLTVAGSATSPLAPLKSLGTAAKPSFEPFVLARKPIIGTVANNVCTYGTGALNIDASRIESTDSQLAEKYASVRNAGPRNNAIYGGDARDRSEGNIEPHEGGRWPANLILDGSDAVVAGFPTTAPSRQGTPRRGSSGDGWGMTATGAEYADEGSAARFFKSVTFEDDDVQSFIYCPKASTSERNAGLEGLPVRSGGEATDRKEGSAGLDSPRAGAGRTGANANTHPTIKPLALMRYLVTLVTPPGGVVLDPFLGSGTTAVAAILDGFDWIGCEMTEEYWPIIEGRVAWAEETRFRTPPSLFDVSEVAPSNKPVAPTRLVAPPSSLFDVLADAQAS